LNDLIPVCEPTLGGNELKYVTEAVSTGWISSSGPYIARFEQAFAEYCGVGYGVAVTNGTVALHLALRALEIGPGDEVIVPSFTMVASAFAVCYCGAMPVFVDVDPETWNLDLNQVEAKLSPKTKAVMPVHVFGTMCDMSGLQSLADRNGFHIVEDAAEAHGAEFGGKKAGSFSSVSAFSFFANKNIATGEGGMVLTNDERLYQRARSLKNLCFPLDGSRRYEHDEIGYNYRMTNIHAALGLAQTERADHYRALRIRNHEQYKKNLAGLPGIRFQKVPEGTMSVHWMNAVLIDPENFGASRDTVIQHLKENGIETRLLFTGMHLQKALLDYGCDGAGEYPVTEELTAKGFYLPSASHLGVATIERICASIRECRQRR